MRTSLLVLLSLAGFACRPAPTDELTDFDLDGVPDAFDCAPSDPARFPGNEEVCNGIDDDCDGATGESGARVDGITKATIQEAIDLADPGDTVEVCAGTYAGTLAVDKDLVLASLGGPEVTTLDAHGEGSAVAVGNGADFTLRGFTVLNGSGTPVDGWIGDAGPVRSGGGMHAADVGDIVIDHADFVGNGADHGGALRVAHAASVTITDTRFDRNQASARGGALSVEYAGDVQLDRVAFEGNEAATGGALALDQIAGSCLLGELTVTGNAATSSAPDAAMGGGLALDATCALVDSVVEGNSAPDGMGGGLAVRHHDLTLTRTSITGNTAESGAGVYLEAGRDGDVAIVGDGTAMIAYNDADVVDWEVVGGSSAGGGIAGRIVDLGGAVRLSGLTIEENVSYAGGGGGVYVEDYGGTGAVVIEDTRVARNVALDAGGGGVFIANVNGSAAGGPDVSILASEVTDNTVSANIGLWAPGGGVVLVGSQDTLIEGSSITRNEAGEGGGLWLYGATSCEIRNSHVDENVGRETGGGARILSNIVPPFHFVRADCTFTDSTVSGNYARGWGGGIDTDGSIHLRRTTMQGNSSTFGGALALWGHNAGTGRVDGDTDSVITENWGHWGGAIQLFSWNGAGYEIEGLRMTANGSEHGGAVANDDIWPGVCGTLALNHVELAANYASEGGALYAGCPMTITDSIVERNLGDSGGGAFVMAPAVLSSASTSWGEGPEDNTPDDANVAGISYPSMGPTFTCAGATGACATP